VESEYTPAWEPFYKFALVHPSRIPEEPGDMSHGAHPNISPEEPRTKNTLSNKKCPIKNHVHGIS